MTVSGTSKVPAFQSPFRWHVFGFVFAILLMAAAGWFFESRYFRRPAIEKSIAVLPFANLSGDKEEEYFSDGMTEDVITQLSKVADLKVISRTSVMPYKNSKKSLREIAKELGVAVVLEGSVRPAGNRLRIVGQLIDASTDEHIWADTYDREMQDVFAIQSDVAQQIADALKTKLSPAVRERIEKKPTENLAAYDLYLKARDSMNRANKKDSAQAVDLFKKAIQLDPRFALAFAGLADAYSVSIIYGAPDSILDTSIEISKKAISLDPNLAEGYEALGYAYQFKSWYHKALEMEQKALDLNPNYARAAGVLGKILWLLGRLDESLPWVIKYQQLDPTSPTAARYVGDVNRMLGKVAEAKKWYYHCLALDPNSRECYWYLMYTVELYGDYKQLKPLEEKLLAIAPDEPGTFEALRNAEVFIGNLKKAKEYDMKLQDDSKDEVTGYILCKEGNMAEAKKIFGDNDERIQERTKRGMEGPGVFFGVAAVQAIKGDNVGANRFLRQAVDAGFIEYRELQVSPLYENLRSDSEFQQIIANLKGRVDEMRKRVEDEHL